MELGSRYGPPMERKSDGSLYQMTSAQKRLAVQLIEKNCCNYWNATRLFSVLYSRTLHVGRVLTPTLAMAVVRKAEIAAFVQESFYTVEA